MTALQKTLKMISSMTEAELSDLRLYLSQIPEPVSAPSSKEIPVRASREVLGTKSHGSKCYRLEKTKCGKKNCKCVGGDLHGPYWYAYYRDNGKLKCEYIGRRFPLFHPAVVDIAEKLQKKAKKKQDRIAKLLEISGVLRLQSAELRDRLR